MTTYLKVSEQFFEVDKQQEEKSFTALTGAVTTTEGVEVTNAQVYGTDSIYTLTFQTENDIPANGFIKVEVPPQIQIDINTVKSKGTCADSPCTEATNESQVQYLMTAGSKANTPIVIKIGGVVNPRSMEITDDFVVTTLDTDGVSEIDSGYNKRARMTKVGEIQSVLFVPSSDVNGKENEYTFTMYSPIPI